MAKIAFVPLNTNHVQIFLGIINNLNSQFEFYCHDRISDASQYQTEKLLSHFQIPYCHFPIRIVRTQQDHFLKRVIDSLKIRKNIQTLLDMNKPEILVLAIDNDPIAQYFISEARKKKIRMVLIQEALIRPFELEGKPRFLSDYLFSILRKFGIFLNYIIYSQGGCDKIIVAGNRARDILIGLGIKASTVEVLGQAKFDETLWKIKDLDLPAVSKGPYLFIASTLVVYDKANIEFLKKLIQISIKLGIHLIIKLHPRTPLEPLDIFRILQQEPSPTLQIIKSGDDTFEILKRVEALITVSSTVILEALLLNKKCVVVDYLAGVSQLNYDSYGAVFSIKAENEIEKILTDCSHSDKPWDNKQQLLRDELFQLDGQSGKRIANFLDQYANQLKP